MFQMEHVAFGVSTRIDVSFGDCDPAGIVFYPHFFEWLDRTFQASLKPLGGHAAICERLDAVGIGVINVEAQFRRPVRDGDALILTCTIFEWSARNVTLDYSGSVDDRVVLKARESRGVFCWNGREMYAEETRGLRDLIEGREKQ
jgi:4-hydroxybenzoyl-CoA thioesterase